MFASLGEKTRWTIWSCQQIESGAQRIDCLALFVYPPPWNLIRGPTNWLPSTVRVSSTILFGAPWIDCLALFMRPPLSSMEPTVTGKYVFCYFSDRFLRQTCVYVYIMLLVLFVCVCFVLCREGRRRDRSRHRLITDRAKTNEISVLSLLSSYLW